MKKLLFGLFIAIAFMSCKGDDGRDGRDGVDGKDGAANIFTNFYTIEEADWVLAGSEAGKDAYYFAERHVPELTDAYVFDKGMPHMYMVDPEYNVNYQMPYSVFKDGYSVRYSVDYEWDNNNGYYIRFYAKSSDFKETRKPSKESFYFAVIW